MVRRWISSDLSGWVIGPAFLFRLDPYFHWTLPASVSVFYIPGFKRKEFRGKLAIAITANFINRNTTAEAKVEEISGVAFIFNQKFFLDLKEETGGFHRTWTVQIIRCHNWSVQIKPVLITGLFRRVCFYFV